MQCKGRTCLDTALNLAYNLLQRLFSGDRCFVRSHTCTLWALLLASATLMSFFLWTVELGRVPGAGDVRRPYSIWSTSRSLQACSHHVLCGLLYGRQTRTSCTFTAGLRSGILGGRMPSNPSAATCILSSKARSNFLAAFHRSGIHSKQTTPFHTPESRCHVRCLDPRTIAVKA